MKVLSRIDQRAAFVTIGLTSTAAMVVVVVVGHVSRELLQPLMVIAGALFGSSLSLLPHIISEPGKVNAPAIGFDGITIQADLKDVIDSEFVEIAAYPSEASWDPSVEALLLQDPTLALAKVRIDIEREVRRIASQREMLHRDDPVSLLRLLDKVEKGTDLPKVTFTAIRDILPICNAALHGRSVSAETASRIIDVATGVMQIIARHGRY